jgi:hypothetical protein
MLLKIDQLTAGYGQAEDYTINIQALTPCTGTPEAGTGASSLSTVCLNQQFTLKRMLT